MQMFVERRNERRVVFGMPLPRALRDEMERLGAERVAIVTSPRRIADGEAIARLLPGVRTEVVGLAREHVPETVVDQAVGAIDRFEADAVLTHGGGSTVGLGKALRQRRPLSFVAVPTTYAGSEMTDIVGIRRGDAKAVSKDAAARPHVVIYDPSQTLDLPRDVSVTSLFNAMAHAVDAAYGGPDPPLSNDIETSIARLAAALPQLFEHPRDLEVRALALHGAYLAGAILGRATMALHHKLAHVLGGTFDLPHAVVHTVVLPHVVAFNAAAAPEATALVGRALGVGDPATALYDLARAVGAPTDLASVGFRPEHVEAAATAVARATYPNPRHGTVDELVELLHAIRIGTRPTT